MDMPDARHALLRGLIDHAPTFPPAALEGQAALDEDRRAVADERSWILARLVWPASRLDELRSNGRAVSAVLDAGLPTGTSVEAVEARYRDDLAALVGLAPEVYVEVPIDDDLEQRLDQLVELGLSAKVRCGGLELPSSDDLARFIRACRERGLAFKATAGLHHAVRSNGEHGLLNVLAATVFAGEEDDALAELDAAVFDHDESGFRWRGRAASVEEVTLVRASALRSIGSCSFFEPVEELEALGMLPP
jgi:hypothetical protein